MRDQNNIVRHQTTLIPEDQKTTYWGSTKTCSLRCPVKMKTQRIKNNWLGINKKRLHFVACAAFPQVQISRLAQHFRKVRYRFRGTRSTFARYVIDFAAGAALSQGEVQTSWQAQYFRKVRCTFVRQAQHKVLYRFCGRRRTLPRSGTDFMAGKILSQGQVPSSWQVQHFRTAARAALSQGAIISRQAQHFRRGVGGGGPPMMFEEVMLQPRVMMIEEFSKKRCFNKGG